MKDRTLLMIPGPIEFEPEVLLATGAPTNSHVAADFVEVFGRSLERMRSVWRAPTGQPFILAGSGTLAMDSAGANLVEPGDRVLVLSTGVFGERFADILRRYGADVTVLRSPVGVALDFDEIESAVRGGDYKLVTATHVDTSTAVRVDAARFGALGCECGVLTVLDGVCSVAGEEIRQDEWGLDVVLTASQKAIGVPPGLALLVAGPRAMEAWRKRRAPVGSFFADWGNWLPIMTAYEQRRPSYFATPAVNLVCALDVALGHILAEGLDMREARHRRLGAAARAALTALGLTMVPTDQDHAANTLSAPRYPRGVSAADLLPRVQAAGVVVAGGLHPEIRNEYFRIGHMGAARPGDLLAAIGAVEAGLLGCGCSIEAGVGVAAAQSVFQSSGR